MSEKFQIIFKFINVPILLIDKSLEINISNIAAQKLLGYSREHLRMMDIRNLIHPEDRQAFLLIYQEGINSRNYENSTIFRLIKKDGNIISCILNIIKQGFPSEGGPKFICQITNIP